MVHWLGEPLTGVAVGNGLSRICQTLQRPKKPSSVLVVGIETKSFRCDSQVGNPGCCQGPAPSFFGHPLLHVVSSVESGAGTAGLGRGVSASWLPPTEDMAAL